MQDCTKNASHWDNVPPSFFFLNAGTTSDIEATLCNLLQSSGESTFAEAKDCQIRFLHKPHDTTAKGSVDKLEK